MQNTIDKLGLNYNAVFVPQSQSRNAGEKNPSLNWKITIKKSGQSLTTDYMQGIGHAPNYEQSFKQNGWKEKYFSLVAERGKYKTILKKFSDGRIDWYDVTESMRQHQTSFLKPLSIPELKDVLYSLVMDSDVLNYSEFEEWAENFGYETDSRKAEKIYKDCLNTALKLRSIIGQDGIDTLNKLFEDY